MLGRLLPSCQAWWPKRELVVYVLAYSWLPWYGQRSDLLMGGYTKRTWTRVWSRGVLCPLLYRKVMELRSGELSPACLPARRVLPHRNPEIDPVTGKEVIQSTQDSCLRGGRGWPQGCGFESKLVSWWPLLSTFLFLYGGSWGGGAHGTAHGWSEIRGQAKRQPLGSNGAWRRLWRPPGANSLTAKTHSLGHRGSIGRNPTHALPYSSQA